jgi:hypothetical protein
MVCVIFKNLKNPKFLKQLGVSVRWVCLGVCQKSQKSQKFEKSQKCRKSQKSLISKKICWARLHSRALSSSRVLASSVQILYLFQKQVEFLGFQTLGFKKAIVRVIHEVYKGKLNIRTKDCKLFVDCEDELNKHFRNFRVKHQNSMSTSSILRGISYKLDGHLLHVLCKYRKQLK